MAEWTLKEHSEGELVVNVSGDDWKKPLEKAFRKLSKRVEIPGFRKGAVPKAMLKRYLPDVNVQYEAVEAIANEWLNKALKELKLDPVSQPALDVRNMDNDSVDLVFMFAVKPEVVLGEYKGLPYNLETVEVTDEDVAKEIDRMRDTYADMETVEGAAEDGDTVNIDYEGFKDGVPFEGGKDTGHDLKLGSGSFIPGFEEQLIGAKAGDEKDLTLTFPEDYHAEDLAGKEVVFKVKVNEVKRRVLPELDDDFAKDVNAPGVETVDDLRRTVRERLENSRKAEAERKADNELFEALEKSSEIDLPKAMIDEECENLYRQFTSQIMQYGMKPDQYLKMMGQTEEALKETYRKDAERNVRLRLTLEAIAAAEALEATDEDIEKEYQNIADMYQMEVDEIKKVLTPEMLKADVLNQKASDFVKEHASHA
jgi:trigger factor